MEEAADGYRGVGGGPNMRKGRGNCICFSSVAIKYFPLFDQTFEERCSGGAGQGDRNSLWSFGTVSMGREPRADGRAPFLVTVYEINED